MSSRRIVVPLASRWIMGAALTFSVGAAAVVGQMGDREVHIVAGMWA